MHRDADCDRLDLEQRGADVVAEIGLRQDDDRRGAALPTQRQVSLEPPDVEVAVEAGGQEDDVDVRGDDLLDRLAVGGRGHPRELRPAGHDRLDERPLGPVRIRDGDPVADRGQVAALAGGMAKPAGELGRAVRAVVRVDDVGAPVLDGDARGLEAVGGERGELFFEGWSPAELCKQREFPFQRLMKAAVAARNREGRVAGV